MQMNKSGFWNFLGLASWKNMDTLEQDIKKLQTEILEQQKKSEEHIVEKVCQAFKEQKTNIAQVSFLIGNSTAELSGKLQKLQEDLNRIQRSLDRISEENQKEHGALEKTTKELTNSIADYYNQLNVAITEYNGILKSADWKIGTSLAVFKNDLIEIIDRIDNMDPIVHLEKIENLLKMLVINDMLDDVDSISK